MDNQDTGWRKALIVGASGGIGAAMADALETGGTQVVRLSRGTAPRLDLEDEASIMAAADALRHDGPFDLLLIASGLLHDESMGPEKSWKDLAAPPLDRIMRVNATGPMLVIRHFLPLFDRKAPGAIAALSARVGSISDNRLGGWYGYRASKAALNQYLRTLSIDLARTHKQLVVAGLHPGTVDTGLSQPFQGNVPDGQLFTPKHSAARLLDVLRGLDIEDSGQLFDHAGKVVAP